MEDYDRDFLLIKASAALLKSMEHDHYDPRLIEHEIIENRELVDRVWNELEERVNEYSINIYPELPEEYGWVEEFNETKFDYHFDRLSAIDVHKVLLRIPSKYMKMSVSEFRAHLEAEAKRSRDEQEAKAEAALTREDVQAELDRLDDQLAKLNARRAELVRKLEEM